MTLPPSFLVYVAFFVWIRFHCIENGTVIMSKSTYTLLSIHHCASMEHRRHSGRYVCQHLGTLPRVVHPTSPCSSLLHRARQTTATPPGSFKNAFSSIPRPERTVTV